MGFVGDYLSDLVSEGLLHSGDLRGCAESEIAQVAEAQQVRTLPVAYEELLRDAGHGAGDLMRGSDWLFTRALTLRSGAEDLLVENGEPVDVLAGSVVFLMHQGYLFYYFPAAHLDEPDPPVWLYLEGDPDTPREVERHFSDFLGQMKNELIMLRGIQEKNLADGLDLEGNPRA